MIASVTRDIRLRCKVSCTELLLCPRVNADPSLKTVRTTPISVHCSQRSGIKQRRITIRTLAGRLDLDESSRASKELKSWWKIDECVSSHAGE